MPIKNINALQNPEHIIEDKNIQQEMIQSLANLGQRVGIKGDSITYSSFNLIESFNCLNTSENNISLKLENIKQDINNYIGYIQYINSNSYNIGKIGIISKDNLYLKGGNINNIDIQQNSINENNLELEISDIFNYKIFENDFNISGINYINNIENYLNKSIIKIANNKLYSLLFGKTINSNDIEILFDIYDLNTNKPLKSIRIFKNNESDIDDNIFYLFEFNYITKILKIYELSSQEININIDSTLLYSGSILSSIESYFNLFDFDKIDIYEIIKLFNNLINENGDTILKYFYVYGNSYEMSFNYDDENNTKISTLYQSSETLFYTNTNKELNYSIIQNRINYLNNDINELFIRLLEYYHNYFLCKNKSTLYLRILQNIYETLVYNNGFNYENNISIEDFDFSSNNYILYFPLNYELSYVCNKNNIFDIFYTNDFFVNKLNLEDIINDNISYNQNIYNNLLFSSNIFTQSIFETYNIKFNYNLQYTEYINSIDVKYLYSLPYIDINTTNWFINGQNSGLTSYLTNDNLQNILMIYTYEYNESTNTLDAEYLNNINESLQQYYNNSNFKVYSFEVLSTSIQGESINIPEIKNITLYTALPNINNTYIKNTDVYKNTLVVSITSSIQDNDLLTLNSDFLMITLWKFNVETLDWEILKDKNSNTVLDLSKFLNLGLIKQRKLDGQSYIFKYIGILLNNLTELNDYEKFSKIMLIQKEYNEIIENKDQSNQKVYKNDLSTIIRYNESELNISNNVLDKTLNELNSSTKFLSLEKNVNNEDAINIVIDYNKLYNINNLLDINNDSLSYKSSELSNSQIIETEQSWEVENVINESKNVNSSINKYLNIGDYIFGTNIPNINLGEVFLSNSQILNRLNFITLNKSEYNNYFYHTFIGSDYDFNKKNVFCIKSDNINYNIGNNTLLNSNNIDQFDIQPKFYLGFNEIELNGKYLYSSSLYDVKEKVSKNITKYYKTLKVSVELINHLDVILNNSNNFTVNVENNLYTIDNNNQKVYTGIYNNSNNILTQESVNYLFNTPINVIEPYKVISQEEISGEHYSQDEINNAQEGDEAYGKTTNDWKIFPRQEISEIRTKLETYIEFDIIKYLNDNFELFYKPYNLEDNITKYEYTKLSNVITEEDNTCEINNIILNISKSYTNNFIDPSIDYINNLHQKIFIIKYGNYFTLAINKNYIFDTPINIDESNIKYISNILFNIRLEKIEINNDQQLYNKYIIVAE